MKITKDGFIWKLLTEKEAMAYFNDEHLGELYLLFDDDSESLVERNSDILEHDGEYGIEVGKISTEKLEEILESRGYCTRAMWQISDVDNAVDGMEVDRNYSDSDKMEILNTLVESESVMEECFSQLDHIITHNHT